MNFSKPLFWHQGLFLKPQHFQYQSLHANHVDYQLVKNTNSYPWGVTEIQLENQALSRGQIDFTHFELIFEDGSLINYPENVFFRSRSFEAHWQDRTEPFPVYLCLAKLSESYPNVTQVTSYDNAPDVNTRFISLLEGEDFNDLHQGEQTTSLKTMDYVVRVVFENELDDYADHLLLPVATLEQYEDDIRFSSSFIPPSLNIKASHVLTSLLKDVRDELLGRSKQLENYKSVSTSRSAEFNPVAERYRSALRMIARFAPLLNTHIENNVVHPLVVFGQLKSFVGELTTFSSRYNLMGESHDGSVISTKYNHQDLFHSFNDTKKLIVNLLDELTVSPELLVRFERDDNGRYHCDLPREFFVKQHSMYLLLETNMPFSDHMSSFKRFAKLGAQSQVEQFVQRAIPGVEFEHIEEQPVGLDHRSKVTYFSIDRSSAKWNAVEQQGIFSLQWDDAPEDLSVEMVLVRG